MDGHKCIQFKLIICAVCALVCILSCFRHFKAFLSLYSFIIDNFVKIFSPKYIFKRDEFVKSRIHHVLGFKC